MGKWMIGIHLFVGTGAIAGGAAAVVNPINPLGIPSEMLERSPFTDYLIPGLFLLIVLGFGSLITAFLLARKAPLHGLVSGAMSAVLVFWIVIQCFVLGEIGALHVFFLAIGVGQGVIALIYLIQNNLFPVNLFRS